MFSLWGFFMAISLISAIVMVGLILLQQGKGADMGASFGAGASGSLFGASGSSNPLSKATAIAATIFFVCTLTLTYIDYHNSARAEAAPTGKVDSVLNQLNTAVSAAQTAASSASAASASAAASAPTAAASAVAAAAAASAPNPSAKAQKK